MKKFFFALITGLLLAGGTVRAVPNHIVNATQDEWRVLFEIRLDPQEAADLYIDGRFVTDRGYVWSYYWVESDPYWNDTAFITTIGDHDVLFRLGDGTELTGQYTIFQPTEPMPPDHIQNVPDGGATAALLGLGFLGLVFHRRLQAPR